MSDLKCSPLSIFSFSFLLCLYFCLFQEINLDDETWFLQVVRRTVSGEKLYRDIFLGTTPLSVYVAGFFCRLFGSELLVVRGVLALYFSLSTLFSCLIYRELKGNKAISLLFILAFFVFSHAQASWGFSGYNGLARVLFLGTVFFAIKAIHPPSFFFLLLSSVFAGLCFCAKQNVGLIAFLCLLAVFLLKAKKKRLVGIFGISLSFFLICWLCLSPLIFEGGWNAFIEYCFENKKYYVQAEHCPYFLLPPSWNSFSLYIFAWPFLLILSYGAMRKNESPYKNALWIFLGGSLLTLFPRPDNIQKMTFIPLSLLILAYCYQSCKDLLSRKIQRMVEYGTASWILLAFILCLGTPIIKLAGGKLCRSDLPHFRCLFLEKNTYRHWKKAQMQFSAQARSEPSFFLSTHAGFYYLLFDLKNPTPFDYPIQPALGYHGEKQIEENIRSQKIKNVYQDHHSWGNWEFLQSDRRPLDLEAFIRENMIEITGIYQGVPASLFQIFKLSDQVETKFVKHYLE